MSKNCNQVSIPTIDNTELECDYFTESTCVIIKKICKQIGNLEGESLDKVIERICLKFSKFENEIYSLNQDIKVLKNKIKNLEDNV